MGNRSSIRPGAAMFLAVAYDTEGNVVDSAGPYTTKGSAAGQVRHLLRAYWRRGAIARVVTCAPEWTPVDRTEVRA